MISYIITFALILLLVFIFSSFRPAATGKITDDLYAVHCGFVNFYVLKTSAGAAVFDTGISPTVARYGLRKLGVSPDTVTHVFLTHTDYDHTGGLAAFPQAKRYLSNAEETMINGTTPRRGLIYNKRMSDYHMLENGETVMVGEKSIQLLHTPGHTPGSASYLINNVNLVTGDLLRLSRKGDILPFLPLMNMSHQKDIESIEAVRHIIEKAEYILTAHTGYIKRK